ncbi:hypothetical protein C8J57DRAFT_1500422 [Mycena rebaudengoi]|nr:hypothetical protein C8J57DRAFT_1500422 [Mycena rebaudengoi]
MGPGSRQDTLDDIFGAHNYRKMLTLDKWCILQKRMVEAIKEVLRQQSAFDAFTRGLESASEGIAMAWGEEEEAWQADHTKECPYEVKRNSLTMKDVELELAKEEYEETESQVQVVHSSSRSTFIVLGLEIEEFQEVIWHLLELEVCAKQQATTYQELEFEQLQAFDVENKKEPESIKLFLPSGIANPRARGAACAPGIADIEA